MTTETPTCLGCGGDPSSGPGHPPLRDGFDLCAECWIVTTELIYGGKIADSTPVPEIRRLVRERAQAAMESRLVAMCPRCKRIVGVSLKSPEEAVLRTHDIAPMLRQVCAGSGESVSYEGAYAAASEVSRLTGWLRAIAYTPHLGCDKTPTSAAEIIDQVDKSIDVHGKSENPNCGTCKAQAALSGRPAP